MHIQSNFIITTFGQSAGQRCW